MTDAIEPAEPDYTQTDYVVADQSGRILFTGRVPAFMLGAQPIQSGQAVVLGTGSHATQYVVNGALVDRPANTSSISGMKISNVPNPSSVTIDDGEPTTVTDGEVDLGFTLPGTYSVRVSSWPALDAVFEVTQS